MSLECISTMHTAIGAYFYLLINDSTSAEDRSVGHLFEKRAIATISVITFKYLMTCT